MDLGQLFVIGVEGTRFDDGLRRLLHDLRPGGLILFQRNLRQDLPPAAARRALAELTGGLRDCAREAGLPSLFLMLDHEGGRVHRLEGAATRFPPPGRLAALAPERIAAVHRQQADELRALGFNTVLGPVLDVCPAEGTRSHIAARSYGGQPELAADLGALAVGAFLERGLLPVPKHFPGYGAAPVDPHQDLPRRDDALEALEATDLLPFRRAVAAGAPLLMTAHIVASCLDAERPVTLSPPWLRHLRRELGFQGCVLSDDLCMASVRARHEPGELAELSLRAGQDLLLVCQESPQTLGWARRELEAAAAADPALEARAQQALRRVQAARALIDQAPPPPALEAALFAAGEALRAELAAEGVSW